MLASWRSLWKGSKCPKQNRASLLFNENTLTRFGRVFTPATYGGNSRYFVQIDEEDLTRQVFSIRILLVGGSCEYDTVTQVLNNVVKELDEEDCKVTTEADV
jgi:hypothetical protein